MDSIHDDGQKGRFGYISIIGQASKRGWMWSSAVSGCKHQTAFCGIGSAQIGAFYLRLTSRSSYLACLACQTPTNPQLSYLAKGCWSNFTTFPTLPCSHSCWKRCICKICTCTSILLISSCPVGSSIINETPTNLSSCHCHCAKPRMSDEKKADSMHVWFEKLT